MSIPGELPHAENYVDTGTVMVRLDETHVAFIETGHVAGIKSESPVWDPDLSTIVCLGVPCNETFTSANVGELVGWAKEMIKRFPPSQYENMRFRVFKGSESPAPTPSEAFFIAAGIRWQERQERPAPQRAYIDQDW